MIFVATYVCNYVMNNEWIREGCMRIGNRGGSLTAVSMQGISRSMIMSTTATMTVETAAPMALLQILSPLYSLLFSL